MKQLKDFATKQDFFSYLVKNKKEHIEFKLAQRKMADAFSMNESETGVIKSLTTNHKDDISSGKIVRTLVLNTYNWMDSHDDVHLNNVFAQSIQQRQDKIWHLHDHEYKVDAKVGKPLSIYEKSVSWKDLGVNIPGNTMALFMDSEIIKEWNPKIFDMYLKGEINQHSVGMRYVSISLAVNDPEQKEEYAQWNNYINLIGNKDKVIEQGYFFPVKEAGLVEGSCVLAGSNELTPTVDNEEKTEEPPIVKVEPTFYQRLGAGFKTV